jgi:hypothetical protein
VTALANAACALAVQKSTSFGEIVTALIRFASRDFIMSLVAIPRRPPLGVWLTTLALFAGGMMILSVAAVGELASTPISCEHHTGSFSNGFSRGFDIDRFECKSGWVKNSPKAIFWQAPPYVAFEWGAR